MLNNFIKNIKKYKKNRTAKLFLYDRCRLRIDGIRKKFIEFTQKLSNNSILKDTVDCLFLNKKDLSFDNKKNYQNCKQTLSTEIKDNNKQTIKENEKFLKNNTKSKINLFFNKLGNFYFNVLSLKLKFYTKLFWNISNFINSHLFNFFFKKIKIWINNTYLLKKKIFLKYSVIRLLKYSSWRFRNSFFTYLKFLFQYTKFSKIMLKFLHVFYKNNSNENQIKVTKYYKKSLIIKNILSNIVFTIITLVPIIIVNLYVISEFLLHQLVVEDPSSTLYEVYERFYDVYLLIYNKLYFKVQFSQDIYQYFLHTIYFNKMDAYHINVYSKKEIPVERSVDKIVNTFFDYKGILQTARQYQKLIRIAELSDTLIKIQLDNYFLNLPKHKRRSFIAKLLLEEPKYNTNQFLKNGSQFGIRKKYIIPDFNLLYGSAPANHYFLNEFNFTDWHSEFKNTEYTAKSKLFFNNYSDLMQFRSSYNRNTAFMDLYFEVSDDQFYDSCKSSLKFHIGNLMDNQDFNDIIDKFYLNDTFTYEISRAGKFEYNSYGFYLFEDYFRNKHILNFDNSETYIKFKKCIKVIMSKRQRATNISNIFSFRSIDASEENYFSTIQEYGRMSEIVTRNGDMWAQFLRLCMRWENLKVKIAYQFLNKDPYVVANYFGLQEYLIPKNYYEYWTNLYFSDFNKKKEFNSLYQDSKSDIEDNLFKPNLNNIDISLTENLGRENGDNFFLLDFLLDNLQIKDKVLFKNIKYSSLLNQFIFFDNSYYFKNKLYNKYENSLKLSYKIKTYFNNKGINKLFDIYKIMPSILNLCIKKKSYIEFLKYKNLINDFNYNYYNVKNLKKNNKFFFYYLKKDNYLFKNDKLKQNILYFKNFYNFIIKNNKNSILNYKNIKKSYNSIFYSKKQKLDLFFKKLTDKRAEWLIKKWAYRYYETITGKHDRFFYIFYNLLNKNEYPSIFFKNYISGGGNFIKDVFIQKSRFFYLDYKKNNNIIRYVLNFKDNIRYSIYLKNKKNTLSNKITGKLVNSEYFSELKSFSTFETFNSVISYDTSNLLSKLKNNDEFKQLLKYLDMDILSIGNLRINNKYFNIDTFIEEYTYFFSYDKFDELSIDTLIRLYIGYLHNNGVDIKKLTIQIDELFLNYLNFKKLLFFIYINKEKINPEISNNFNTGNLDKKFYFKTHHKNYYHLLENHKIFELYKNFSLNFIKNTPIEYKNQQNQEYPYLYPIYVYKNKNKNYFYINYIKYNKIVLLDLYTCSSMYNQRNKHKTIFNDFFKLKLNFIFINSNYYKKHYITLFKNFRYKIYYNKLNAIFSIKKNKYSLDLIEVLHNLIKIVTKCLLLDFKNHINFYIIKIPNKLKSFPLFSYFVNNKNYLSNTNVYLGQNLSIQNEDVTASSLALLAIVKESILSTNSIYKKNKDSLNNKFILFNKWWFINIKTNSILSNTTYQKFKFYLNYINNKKICFCTNKDVNNKNEIWDKFWMDYNVYYSIFADNYYNLYLINNQNINHVSYTPQIMYNSFSGGYIYPVYSKFDKNLIKTIEKLKKNYKFNINLKNKLILKYNNINVCTCKSEPYLGNLIYYKINKYFKNNTNFNDKVLFNLINFKYFFNNFLYSKKYDRFQTFRHIYYIKNLLKNNELYCKFNIIDILNLVANVYFINNLKYYNYGLHWIKIPNINTLPFNYQESKTKNHFLKIYFSSKKQNYRYLDALNNLKKLSENNLIYKMYALKLNQKYKNVYKTSVKNIFSNENLQILEFDYVFKYDLNLVNNTLNIAVPALYTINKEFMTSSIDFINVDKEHKFSKITYAWVKRFNDIDRLFGLVPNNRIKFNNIKKNFYLTTTPSILKENINRIKNFDENNYYRLNKYISLILNKKNKNNRKLVIFGNIINFKVFLLSYLENILFFYKKKIIFLFIKNKNFYNRNYKIFMFLANNKKTYLRYIIVNNYIFKNNNFYSSFINTFSILKYIYKIKLLKYTDCAFNNTHFYLISEKYIKKYLNLRKTPNLYYKYISKVHSLYKNSDKNYWLFKNISYRSIDNFDHLVDKDWVTQNKRKNIKEWKNYANKINNKFTYFFEKNMNYILKDTYNNKKIKDNHFKKIITFNNSENFIKNIIASYSFGNFVFDCFLKIKNKPLEYNTTKFKIYLYSDFKIKRLQKITKFCYKLKKPNFYNKNWIKCAYISKLFNFYSKNLKISNKVAIAVFYKYITIFKLGISYNLNTPPKISVSRKQTESLYLLYIFNCILNKNAYISFINFAIKVNNLRLLELKNSILFKIFIKIYTINNFTVNRDFEYFVIPKHKLLLNKFFFREFKQKRVNIIINFLKKKYFMFNTKKIFNIFESDFSNSSNYLNLLFFLLYKYYVLENKNYIKKINLKFYPINFYNKFSKIFNKIFTYSIKTYSNNTKLKWYRFPEAKDKKKIFFCIYNFIYYYNLKNIDHNVNSYWDSRKYKTKLNFHNKKFWNEFNWQFAKNNSYLNDFGNLQINSYLNSKHLNIFGISTFTNMHWYSSNSSYIVKATNRDNALILNFQKYKFFFSKLKNSKKKLNNLYNNIVNLNKNIDKLHLYYNKLWKNKQFKYFIWNKLNKYYKINAINNLLHNYLFLYILKDNKKIINLLKINKFSYNLILKIKTNKTEDLFTSFLNTFAKNFQIEFNSNLNLLVKSKLFLKLYIFYKINYFKNINIVVCKNKSIISNLIINNLEHVLYIYKYKVYFLKNNIFIKFFNLIKSMYIYDNIDIVMSAKYINFINLMYLRTYYKYINLCILINKKQICYYYLKKFDIMCVKKLSIHLNILDSFNKKLKNESMIKNKIVKNPILFLKIINFFTINTIFKNIYTLLKKQYNYKKNYIYYLEQCIISLRLKKYTIFKKIKKLKLFENYIKNLSILNKNKKIVNNILIKFKKKLINRSNIANFIFYYRYIKQLNNFYYLKNKYYLKSFYIWALILDNNIQNIKTVDYKIVYYWMLLYISNNKPLNIKKEIYYKKFYLFLNSLSGKDSILEIKYLNYNSVILELLPLFDNLFNNKKYYKNPKHKIYEFSGLGESSELFYKNYNKYLFKNNRKVILFAFNKYSYHLFLKKNNIKMNLIDNEILLKCFILVKHLNYILNFTYSYLKYNITSELVTLDKKIELTYIKNFSIFNFFFKFISNYFIEYKIYVISIFNNAFNYILTKENKNIPIKNILYNINNKNNNSIIKKQIDGFNLFSFYRIYLEKINIKKNNKLNHSCLNFFKKSIINLDIYCSLEDNNLFINKYFKLLFLYGGGPKNTIILYSKIPFFLKDKKMLKWVIIKSLAGFKLQNRENGVFIKIGHSFSDKIEDSASDKIEDSEYDYDLLTGDILIDYFYERFQKNQFITKTDYELLYEKYGDINKQQIWLQFLRRNNNKICKLYAIPFNNFLKKIDYVGALDKDYNDLGIEYDIDFSDNTATLLRTAIHYNEYLGKTTIENLKEFSDEDFPKFKIEYLYKDEDYYNKNEDEERDYYEEKDIYESVIQDYKDFAGDAINNSDINNYDKIILTDIEMPDYTKFLRVGDLLKFNNITQRQSKDYNHEVNCNFIQKKNFNIFFFKNYLFFLKQTNTFEKYKKLTDIFIKNSIRIFFKNKNNINFKNYVFIYLKNNKYSDGIVLNIIKNKYKFIMDIWEYSNRKYYLIDNEIIITEFKKFIFNNINIIRMFKYSKTSNYIGITNNYYKKRNSFIFLLSYFYKNNVIDINYLNVLFFKKIILNNKIIWKIIIKNYYINTLEDNLLSILKNKNTPWTIKQILKYDNNKIAIINYDVFLFKIKKKYFLKKLNIDNISDFYKKYYKLLFRYIQVFKTYNNSNTIVDNKNIKYEDTDSKIKLNYFFKIIFKFFIKHNLFLKTNSINFNSINTYASTKWVSNYFYNNYKNYLMNKNQNLKIYEIMSIVVSERALFCYNYLNRMSNLKNTESLINANFKNILLYKKNVITILNIIFNIKNENLNLGSYIEDFEVNFKNDRPYFLGSNFENMSLFKKLNSFTDGYEEGLIDSYLYNKSSDYGFSKNIKTIFNVWLSDDYWYNDKSYVFNTMYGYDDWLQNNDTGFYFLKKNDLNYDNEFNLDNKNNLWFFSENAINNHKMYLDSDFIYSNFSKDKEMWYPKSKKKFKNYLGFRYFVKKIFLKDETSNFAARVYRTDKRIDPINSNYEGLGKTTINKSNLSLFRKLGGNVLTDPNILFLDGSWFTRTTYNLIKQKENKEYVEKFYENPLIRESLNILGYAKNKWLFRGKSRSIAGQYRYKLEASLENIPNSSILDRIKIMRIFVLENNENFINGRISRIEYDQNIANYKVQTDKIKFEFCMKLFIIINTKPISKKIDKGYFVNLDKLLNKWFLLISSIFYNLIKITNFQYIGNFIKTSYTMDLDNIIFEYLLINDDYVIILKNINYSKRFDIFVVNIFNFFIKYLYKITKKPRIVIYDILNWLNFYIRNILPYKYINLAPLILLIDNDIFKINDDFLKNSYNSWYWFNFYILFNENACSDKYFTKVMKDHTWYLNWNLTKKYTKYLWKKVTIYDNHIKFNKCIKNPLILNYQIYEKRVAQNLIFGNSIKKLGDRSLSKNALISKLDKVGMYNVLKWRFRNNLWLNIAYGKEQKIAHINCIESNRKEYLKDCSNLGRILLKNWWHFDDIYSNSTYLVDVYNGLFKKYVKPFKNLYENRDSVIIKEYCYNFLSKNFWSISQEKKYLLKKQNFIKIELNKRQKRKKKQAALLYLFSFDKLIEDKRKIKRFDKRQKEFFENNIVLQTQTPIKIKNKSSRKKPMYNNFIKWYKNYYNNIIIINQLNNYDNNGICLNKNENFRKIYDPWAPITGLNFKEYQTFGPWCLKEDTRSKQNKRLSVQYETQNWLKSYEWTPLISNKKLWFVCAKIYNKYLDGKGLWTNYLFEKNNNIYQISSTILYNPSLNIFILQNKKNKVIFNFLNKNIVFNFDNGNISSVVTTPNNTTKNIDIFNLYYDKKNNIYSLYDKNTNRHFDIIAKKYYIYFNDNIYYFNENNLLDLADSLLFFDIKSKILYKKYYNFLNNFIYLPQNLKKVNFYLNKNNNGTPIYKNTSLPIFEDYFDIIDKKKYTHLNRFLYALQKLNNLKYIKLIKNNEFFENSKAGILQTNEQPLPTIVNIKKNKIWNNNYNFNFIYENKLVFSNTTNNTFYVDNNNKIYKISHQTYKHPGLNSTKANFINLFDFYDYNLIKKFKLSNFSFLNTDYSYPLSLCKTEAIFFEQIIEKNAQYFEKYSDYENHIDSSNIYGNHTRKKIKYFILKYISNKKIIYINNNNNFNPKFILINKVFKFLEDNKKTSYFNLYIIKNNKLEIFFNNKKLRSSIYFQFLLKKLYLKNTYNLKKLPNPDINKFVNKKKLPILFPELQYLRFSNKIRESFNLNSIFKDRLPYYNSIDNPNCNIIKKDLYAKTNNYAYSLGDKGMFGALTDKNKKFFIFKNNITFYDILILKDILNYYRFGSNLAAISQNGRIPFTDYVGWDLNDKKLKDGLGWTFFNEEYNIDMNTNDYYKKIPKADLFIKKKIQDFDYFFEDLSDRYDDSGFISIAPPTGDILHEDFWTHFNEIKREQLTTFRERPEDENYRKSKKLKIRDKAYVDIDKSGLKPDDESWKYVLDGYFIPNSILRWTQINNKYHQNFIKYNQNILNFFEIYQNSFKKYVFVRDNNLNNDKSTQNSNNREFLYTNKTDYEKIFLVLLNNNNIYKVIQFISRTFSFNYRYFLNYTDDGDYNLILKIWFIFKYILIIVLNIFNKILIEYGKFMNYLDLKIIKIVSFFLMIFDIIIIIYSLCENKKLIIDKNTQLYVYILNYLKNKHTHFIVYLHYILNYKIVYLFNNINLLFRLNFFLFKNYISIFYINLLIFKNNIIIFFVKNLIRLNFKNKNTLDYIILNIENENINILFKKINNYINISHKIINVSFFSIFFSNLLISNHLTNKHNINILYIFKNSEYSLYIPKKFYYNYRKLGYTNNYINIEILNFIEWYIHSFGISYLKDKLQQSKYNRFLILIKYSLNALKYFLSKLIYLPIVIFKNCIYSLKKYTTNMFISEKTLFNFQENAKILNIVKYNLFTKLKAKNKLVNLNSNTINNKDLILFKKNIELIKNSIYYKNNFLLLKIIYKYGWFVVLLNDGISLHKKKQPINFLKKLHFLEKNIKINYVFWKNSILSSKYILKIYLGAAKDKKNYPAYINTIKNIKETIGEEHAMWLRIIVKNSNFIYDSYILKKLEEETLEKYNQQTLFKFEDSRNLWLKIIYKNINFIHNNYFYKTVAKKQNYKIFINNINLIKNKLDKNYRLWISLIFQNKSAILNLKFYTDIIDKNKNKIYKTNINFINERLDYNWYFWLKLIFKNVNFIAIKYKPLSMVDIHSKYNYNITFIKKRLDCNYNFWNKLLFKHINYTNNNYLLRHYKKTNLNINILKNSNIFGSNLFNFLNKEQITFTDTVMDPYYEKITKTNIWYNGSYYYISKLNGKIKAVNNPELYLFGIYYLKLNENTALTLSSISKNNIINLLQKEPKIYKQYHNIEKFLDLETGYIYIENIIKNKNLKKDYLWNENNTYYPTLINNYFINDDTICYKNNKIKNTKIIDSRIKKSTADFIKFNKNIYENNKDYSNSIKFFNNKNVNKNNYKNKNEYFWKYINYIFYENTNNFEPEYKKNNYNNPNNFFYYKIYNSIYYWKFILTAIFNIYSNKYINSFVKITQTSNTQFENIKDAYSFTINKQMLSKFIESMDNVNKNKNLKKRNNTNTLENNTYNDN